MNWVDLLLLLAFMVGLAAGGYLMARSPTFWFGMALVVFNAIKPWLARPLSPENQKKLDAVRRRAGEWDHLNKKERESR